MTVADDVTLNAMSGGAVVATDDVGGRHVQVIKPAFGGDGVATMVDAANPLPVGQPPLVVSGSGTGSAPVIGPQDLLGYRTIRLTNSGTWSGTLRLQTSLNGTNWFNVDTIASGVGSWPTSFNYSGNLVSGPWVAPVAGRYYRVAFESYTSGTASVTMIATAAATTTLPVVVRNDSAIAVVGTDLRGTSDASSGSNGVFTVSAGLGYNGSTFDRLRTPAVFKSAAATAAGNTAVWTPTASKRFRLLRYKIDVTGFAATAAGGTLTVDLLDAAASFGLTQSVDVPSTAGTALSPGWTSGWIDLGNGHRSSAANAALNVSLSTALTSGTVRVLTAGTEE